MSGEKTVRVIDPTTGRMYDVPASVLVNVEADGGGWGQEGVRDCEGEPGTDGYDPRLAVRDEVEQWCLPGEYSVSTTQMVHLEFCERADADRFAKDVGGGLGLLRQTVAGEYGGTVDACLFPLEVLPEVLARLRAHNRQRRGGVGAVPNGEAE